MHLEVTESYPALVYEDGEKSPTYANLQNIKMLAAQNNTAGKLKKKTMG